MKLEQFNYYLPPDRIAQSPAEPRDSSRLFVYDRATANTTHDTFENLPSYLRPGDVLVFNNTKVFPARLRGRKQTGGKLEVFLLKPTQSNKWNVLIGGKARRADMDISFDRGLRCTTMRQHDDGVWEVRFNMPPTQVMAMAEQIGAVPTPPYIKKIATKQEYQTVYARKIGSVAAPTAGFHFTKYLLDTLTKNGIQLEYITLHVGFGTFQPVKEQVIEKHRMHAEYAEVSAATLKRLRQAKQQGRRIIAVGTTSVRTLETFCPGAGQTDPIPSGARTGWIDTFIYPGYEYQFVDAMITNFHLPKSTLLMLVSAFLPGSQKQQIAKLLELYQLAIDKQYRFYSFGDGMFIM